MSERCLVSEWQENIASAIASCWIMSRPLEGLVRDTFEELMHELQHESHSWEGIGVPDLREALESEDYIWRALGKRFGAVENPLGVITFLPKIAAEKTKQKLRTDFPLLIIFLEGTIPSLTGVAFKKNEHLLP